MSTLVTNIPSIKVFVRKEYLYDLEQGHGDFVEGYWITAKSMPGRAFYFETYLPDYGALYDKLPISAFTTIDKTPTPDLELQDLQFWNCMDYGVAAIEKKYISSADFEIYTRSHKVLKGTYLFTLDNYHEDPDRVDYSTAETPAEHKSFNMIALENGQIAAYPNNRMRVYDNSLTPKNVLTPDFKVSTRYYQVENGYEYRLGDTDNYFWKSE